MWGPYDSIPEAISLCNGGFTADKRVDCSFHHTNDETITLKNGIQGKFYVLLITNYSMMAQSVNFRKIDGPGTTNCGIVDNPPPFVQHLTQFSVEKDTNEKHIGPENCPADMMLVGQRGLTSYPDGTIRILDQNTTTVTVELVQTFTDTNSTIDNIFYQYKTDDFQSECLEEENLIGEGSLEITISCTALTKNAFLEFWVADDSTSGALEMMDQAAIPECCYPSVSNETSVVKYKVLINCETECPDAEL